jgi:PPIC-type PPIASE domain
MRFFASLVRPSRAAVLAAACCAFAGCNGGAFSPDQARTATVAGVPGGTLNGATLERWLLKLPAPPNSISAEVLVSTWINTALMIDALRSNRSLDDSATIDAVIRPDAERGVSMQYLAQRDAKRPPVSDAQADSLADIDAIRVFQQILLRVPPKADSVTTFAAINRAKVLQKRARDGGDFTALAIEASPDSLTRRTGGFLPALSRDQVSRLPQQIQQIWMLKPGDISNVVFSPPASLHIMRRATRAEARAHLKQFLAPILARRADSLFIDSLAAARHIVVAPDARPRVRAMAMEPVVAVGSSPMVTWQGGALTPTMVRSATLMLDPAARVRLSNASYSAITSYLTDLAKRQIMLAVVAPGPTPTPEARAKLAPAYRNSLGMLRASLSRLPTTLNVGDAASLYVDSALTGQRSLALPGALSGVLRSRAKVRVDSVALQSVLRAVAPEWQVLHANDSTAAAKAGATNGTVRPAGPPPR